MIKYKFNLPENLNLEELLKPKHSDFLNRINYFYYIIDKIYTKSIQYKPQVQKSKSRIAKSRLDGTKFIPLNKKRLKEVLPAYFVDTVLNTLQELEIIQCDYKYVPGFKSYGYRLTERYRKSRKKLVANKSWRLIKNINSQIEKDQKKLSSLHKQIQNMISESFEYNFNDAAKYTNSQLKNNSVSDRQFENMKLMNLILKFEPIYLKCSDRSKRIFHSYSNLKKELRQFIQHKSSNEQLVEIDIANSQPFLFAVLCNEFTTNEPDVKHFLELTSTGKFYDFIKSNYRNDFEKVDILAMLYSPDNWNNELKDWMQNIFPTVIDIMSTIKTNYDLYKNSNYMPFKKLHTNFAILLQSLEAEIMIETVAPKLLELDIDFIPVHDSFIVPTSAEQTVRKIIESEFLNLYSVKPLLKNKLVA